MEYDVERIVGGMGSTDAAERLSAAAALEEALRSELEAGRGDWGGLVEQILPPLLDGIGDRHKGVQVHSANCLEFLLYQSEKVAPALRAAMAGPDGWRAWGAALVAARVGYWYPEMAPALAGALGSTDRDVRWAAAGFCLQLGRNWPEAVALVKETLCAGEPLGRKMAAYCLGAMGQYASMEPELAGRLQDSDRDVRRAVVLAIDKLPAVSPAVAAQVEALRADPDEFVRRTAAVVAAKLGSHGR